MNWQIVAKLLTNLTFGVWKHLYFQKHLCFQKHLGFKNILVLKNRGFKDIGQKHPAIPAEVQNIWDTHCAKLRALDPKKTLKKDNTKIAVELLTRIYPGPCKSPHLDMVTIKATDAFSKADSCHFLHMITASLKMCARNTNIRKYFLTQFQNTLSPAQLCS